MRNDYFRLAPVMASSYFADLRLSSLCELGYEEVVVKYESSFRLLNAAIPLLVCMHAPIGCRKLDRRHRFDELCSILSLGLVHRRPDADFSFPVAPVDRASVLTVSVVTAAERSALASAEPVAYLPVTPVMRCMIEVGVKMVFEGLGGERIFAYPKFGNLGCPFEGEGVLDNGVSVCQVWESYQSVVHLRGKRRKTLDAADPKHGHVCIVWRHNCIGSCPRLTKQSNPKVRSIFDEPCRPK
ncbi:hypothetical protein V9T40_003074 [Parthenolecanium corni]|uniref:Uncharacterized protein n=1 Tax=Parthenolecanium corni TaxID=536013 RepID=A0AAN9TPZ9_9HEMI